MTFPGSGPLLDSEDESSLVYETKGWERKSDGNASGKVTSLLKATQGRDITFLPLDIVLSKRWPELGLPWGDHRSIGLGRQTHTEDNGGEMEKSWF